MERRRLPQGAFDGDADPTREPVRRGFGLLEEPDGAHSALVAQPESGQRLRWPTLITSARRLAHEEVATDTQKAGCALGGH
ncbi:MAG: hypothetical protein QOH79_2820, partial [Acidimicrobiaceae bacterium]